MKQVFTSALFIGVLLVVSSFKPESYRDLYKDKGSLAASVDKQVFVLRNENFYRASLVTKAGSMISSASKTATLISFYGADSADAKGYPFSESMTFEYTFIPSTGDIGDISCELHYNFGDYYLMPGDNIFKVSKMDWNADRTSFMLSGEFDCELRKQGFPIDAQPIVRLRGNMNDISVTVPPWIAAKLNSQASLGQ